MELVSPISVGKDKTGESARGDRKSIIVLRRNRDCSRPILAFSWHAYHLPLCGRYSTLLASARSYMKLHLHTEPAQNNITAHGPGYVVVSGERRLYFTGDPINTFADHAELTGAVAALQPALGFMTTHPTEGEFPFFPGSAKMARRCGVSYAVPVHRSCFVKRDYDPAMWAGHFSPADPKPIIVPHNSHFLFSGQL